MTQTGEPGGYTPRAYEAEVYAEVAAANAAKGPWDVDRPDPAAVAVAGEYSIKAAETYQRKVSVDGGGFRDELNASDVDYRAIPHEQLRSIVTDGVSPEDVDEQGLIVNDLGNAFKELSTTFRQAAAKESAGWQGGGAQAALDYLGGYTRWADASGDSAFLAANHYSQTSAALSNAQHSMPEPAGRTVMQSMDLAHRQLVNGDVLGAIGTYKDLSAQANVAMQTQQQAAAVVAQRDQMLHSGGAGQPTYLAPPTPAPPTPTGTGTHTSDPGHPTAPTAVTPPTITHDEPPPARNPVTTGSGPISTTPATSLSPGEDNPAPGTKTNPGPAAAVLSTVASPGGDAERNTPGRPSTPPGRAADRLRAGTGEKPGVKGTAESARGGGAEKSGKAGGSVPSAPGGKKNDDEKERKRASYLVDENPDATYGANIETDADGNKIAPPVIG